MKNTLWYRNDSTGEIIDNHSHAMNWFNDGANITLLQVRNNAWVKRSAWEH